MSATPAMFQFQVYGQKIWDLSAKIFGIPVGVQISDFLGPLPPLVSSNLLVNVSFLGIFVPPSLPLLGDVFYGQPPREPAKFAKETII